MIRFTIIFDGEIKMCSMIVYTRVCIMQVHAIVLCMSV